MLLIAIILSTLAAGIGSVWVAALLMRAGLGSREGGVGQQHLLSLAAGALLGIIDWVVALGAVGLAALVLIITGPRSS